MEKIDILYQFNEKYAPYAGTSITSVFRNNKHIDEIRIFVLGEELSEDSKEKLCSLASEYERQIIFVDTDSLIGMMKEMGMPSYRGSYAANLRLFAGLIPQIDSKRLLYLDADTIVDGQLDELTRLDMRGLPVAMILDSLVRKHKERLGFTEDEPYFNSGVMLFDMEEWRKRNCSERIADHVKNKRAWYPSPDQDLINVVLRGEILKLSPKYNMQPVLLAFNTADYMKTFGPSGYYTFGELCEALKGPVIYHFFRFVGEFPWHEGNVHPDNDLFDRYLLQSPWKEYKKKKAETGPVLKIEKILYRILPKRVFIILFRIAYESFIKKANADSLKEKVNKVM
ncbi:MAG: glycosyltransferase family 8 protein [Lachnospiraceae bacterium]|nr:glycosyltransferase family 8 protein [Lachnospiraceae bacterium]